MGGSMSAGSPLDAALKYAECRAWPVFPCQWEGAGRKRPLIAGSRRVPTALVYIDNVIDAMLAAAKSDVHTGSIYDVVDSDVNQGELGRILGEVSQGYIRPLFVPYFVVWSMMLGVDLISLIHRRQLGTARYRLERTLANMRFKCAAARKELKWTPRVSVAEALARTVESSPDIPHKPLFLR